MTSPNPLPTTSELSKRLSALSRDHFYDVYKQFDWPDELGHDYLGMSPELYLRKMQILGLLRQAKLGEGGAARLAAELAGESPAGAVPSVAP